MTQAEEKDDFIKTYFTSMNKLFGITMDDFLKYYDESKYSGYPEEPGGSAWKSEGKFIYVMVRHVKPKKILEIGNYLGRGTTNHILQAVDMNGVGQVTLLDIVERLEYQKLHSKNFERVLDDSLKFLQKPFDHDMIVQDGNHEYLHVKTELELMEKNAQNDFIMWGHDYFTVRPPQCEIARSWADAKVTKFTERTMLKDSISNCGFIVSKFKR
ncbi:MAG: class I SAM-dependent methyltransferase [Richelia sp. RM2_1_2]|nr:class I SAM-dependent methyltransferase [Richelia sp. RM2_1_2]